jgi:hypothetical protein
LDHECGHGSCICCWVRTKYCHESVGWDARYDLELEGNIPSACCIGRFEESIDATRENLACHRIDSYQWYLTVTEQENIVLDFVCRKPA